MLTAFRCSLAAAVAIVAALASATARAQAPVDFPTAPVRIFVPFRRRRPGRRDHAHSRRSAFGALGKARDRGKSPRRQHHRLDHGAGELAARRPHAGLMRRSSTLITPALNRSLPFDTSQGFFRCQHGGAAVDRAGRTSFVPAEYARGAHRAGQEQARRRSISPRPVRAASATSPARCSSTGRHPDAAHQLQWQRAGVDRRDGRARADHVRHLAFGEAAGADGSSR